MDVRLTASGVEIWTPAKLNLFLEVIERRTDGYHELETLMCPISLYDTLVLTSQEDRSRREDAPFSAAVDPVAGEVSSSLPAQSAAPRAATTGRNIATGRTIAAGSDSVDGSGPDRLTVAWSSLAAGAHAQEPLPTAVDNLVLRAVARLRQAAEAAFPTVDGPANRTRQAPSPPSDGRARWRRGLQITLVKRIPMQAGLGGGSSDAAAALRGAARLWEWDCPDEELQTAAAELGSDVPFFLGDGAAVCRGRGERIAPAPGWGGWHFVLVRPVSGLSTADVFRRCRPPERPRTSAPLMAALRSGDWRGVGQGMFNRLEAPAAELSPDIARCRRDFARLGLIGGQMSGSGSAYFGVCRNRREALSAAARLRAWGWPSVWTAFGPTGAMISTRNQHT